jgi:hypothetical protein
VSEVAKCFSWEALRREAAGRAAEVYARTSQLMAILGEYAKYKGSQPPELGVLAAGLRRDGFARNALGKFIGDVWGVRLCVRTAAGLDCGDRAVAEALAGPREDVVVDVDDAKYGVLKVLNESAGRALELLGVEAPKPEPQGGEAVYRISLDLARALASFLPFTNPCAFFVAMSAQSPRDYFEQAAKEYCGGRGDCARAAAESAERLGATAYRLYGVEMFGYPDQDKAFLEPPRERPDTLGTALLGVMETALYIWRNYEAAAWFPTSKGEHLPALYERAIGDALRGYYAGVCCSGTLKVDAKGYIVDAVGCRWGSAMPIKNYVYKIAPYLLLRAAAMRAVEGGVEVRRRFGGTC